MSDDIRSMYRRPLEGNKPLGARIELTYKDPEDPEKRITQKVVYVPAMIPERYGTNPHQLFAFLVPQDYNFRIKPLKPIEYDETGKSGFSLTNIEDALWAAELLKYIDDPCCVVMKHENPCGAARSDDIIKSFLRAWYVDFLSAFGGVVGFNVPVTREAAQLMVEKGPDNIRPKYFIEVVVAPDFEEGAMAELEERKDLRVLQYEGLENLPKYDGDMAAPVIKTEIDMDSGLSFEDRFLTRVRKPEDLLLKEYTRSNGQHLTGLGVVTRSRPTSEQLKDLALGLYAAYTLRSNSMDIVKQGCLISPGTGKQARVDAVNDSLRKIDDRNRDAIEQGIADERNSIFPYTTDGAVAVSEALFPEPDSIELLGPRGITAVAQTGGSKKDEEIIKAANKYGMAMILTGERSFSHH